MKTLFALTQGLILLLGLSALAEDLPVGWLPDGGYYLKEEIDFALKPEAALALSPADSHRRVVDRARLHGLHPAIREVVAGHSSAQAWLEGRPLPPALRHTGGAVPQIARSLKARLHPGHDAADIVQELRAHPEVAWAHLNPLHHVSAAPNDALWSQQWGAKRVRADDAWEVPQATVSQRIAIIDTGVDLFHPDLAARIVYDRGFGGNGSGDARHDKRGGRSIDHGTHVAGIAAAQRGNGFGIAGISVAGIMAMGCASWNPAADAYDVCCVADAINDAVAHGANVINCSFGNTWSDPFFLGPALDNAQCFSVLVVCAAGNDSKDVDASDSRGWNQHPWPLIVSSTSSDDQLSTFSNFGPAIDLAAPGEGILSTVTANLEVPSALGNYARLSGTSMASPCVAGGAAMVSSMNPDLLFGSAVKDLLFRMAKDLGPPAWDPLFGHGLMQLDPLFLRPLRSASAFVGPHNGDYVFCLASAPAGGGGISPIIGNYEHPFATIGDALGVLGAGQTLVLNGGENGPREYHYAAQSITTPVTLTALPDRPVIIGR